MNDQTAKHDAGTRRLTMAEYIDRYELLNQFLDTKPYKLSGQFEKLICNIPAADVAPVKHGKWFWNPNGMDWGLGAWECSECACRNNNLPMNSKMNPLMFSGSKYCPNCGAKMDLEEHE